MLETTRARWARRRAQRRAQPWHHRVAEFVPVGAFLFAAIGARELLEDEHGDLTVGGFALSVALGAAFAATAVVLLWVVRRSER